MSASPVARAVTRLLCVLLFPLLESQDWSQQCLGCTQGRGSASIPTTGVLNHETRSVVSCRAGLCWERAAGSTSPSAPDVEICLILLFSENLFHSAPCRFNSVPQVLFWYFIYLFVFGPRRIRLHMHMFSFLSQFAHRITLTIFRCISLWLLFELLLLDISAVLSQRLCSESICEGKRTHCGTTSAQSACRGGHRQGWCHTLRLSSEEATSSSHI